jgi:hypothetical protein
MNEIEKKEIIDVIKKNNNFIKKLSKQKQRLKPDNFDFFLELTKNECKSSIKDLKHLFSVIDDYLENLETVKKIKCYNNIIKYCKSKINELHKKQKGAKWIW